MEHSANLDGPVRKVTMVSGHVDPMARHATSLTSSLIDAKLVIVSTTEGEDRIVNLLAAFQLIPALQMIFTTEIEFVEDSFRELTAEQYEIYRRKHGREEERIFEIVPIERTAVERTEEKVTFELSIVMDSQRKLLLHGVKFIYHCTASDGLPAETNFHDRLAYLRKKLPPVMLSMPEV